MKPKLRVTLIVIVLLLGVAGSVIAENSASSIFEKISPSSTSLVSSIFSVALGAGGY